MSDLTTYSIEDKIKYYEARKDDLSISENQRAFAREKLKGLYEGREVPSPQFAKKLGLSTTRR